MEQKIEDQLKDAEKAGYERGVSDKGKVCLIHKALSAVQAKCKPAGKSGKNDFDHYSYAMLQDYIEVVREPMSENGLSVTYSVTKLERLTDRQTSKGGVERVVQVEITATLRHESGECLDFVSYGEGQDRSDKAIYKAITGCKKYLLANIFNIPTTDDPEGDSDTERGMNQDPHGTPPKAPGSARPPRATQPPPKAAPPTGAPAEQPQAQKPPAMTDAERTAAGLIGRQQFEEIKKLLKDKGIDPKKWKLWLAVNASGATSISEIKLIDYLRVRDVVRDHPEHIMNPGTVQTPRADDDLPFY